MAATALADSSSHLLPPSDLKCANRHEPLAVFADQIQFSWRPSARTLALHGVTQTAYQIQVTAHAGEFTVGVDEKLLWDSQKTQSSATFGIPLSMKDLQSSRTYSWRVREWDENGIASGWSRIAHWTQAPVWHASWIEATKLDTADTNERMPLFRKSLRLDSSIRQAFLYASGLGQSEIHVNGMKVGTDLLTPGWSNYRKTVYYDSYDVTRLLKRGENAIGVLVGNGMYRVLNTPGRYTKFTGSFGPPKCFVQIHIEYLDGSFKDIGSNETWKTSPGPITFSSTYGGEDYDSRLEPRGWDTPGFDDKEWKQAVVSVGPGGILQPELAPPIRAMHIYKPVKILHPKPNVAVYDFGVNFAGWPAVAITGPAGSVVKLTPGELLNDDGTVSQRSSGAPQWFTYTLRGAASESWHPRFSYYGFRYVQVDFAYAPAGASSKLPRLLHMQGIAVHTSSSPTGSFSTSDTLLNRIHALILRSIENNAVSLFTDCPHREKLGWLEETHLMAASMLYDFDFAGLYAATARNIADTQATEGAKAGMVSEIAPQYVVFDPKADVFNDSPEWGSAAIIAPWEAYQRSGDLQFLRAQLPVMQSYARYLGTHADNGIVAYGLGDWYDIGPGDPGFSKLTSPGVTATAIYYQDLRVLQSVLALLGREKESQEYANQADSVRKSFNTRFFDTATARYDKGGQTAQAMPLVLGLVSDRQRAAVLDALVEDIRAHQYHVTAGDIGYHYVVQALLEGHRSNVLLKMLQRTDSPSYGYQLAQGATSLTEAWDANPESSQDHFMLGHAEEWFYRGLGGLDIDLSRQEKRRIMIRPASEVNLSWVNSSYNSKLGLIESNWCHTGPMTVYRITIPANATAMVELNTPALTIVTIDRHAATKATGVLSVARTQGTTQLQLASGHYEIHVTGTRNGMN